VRNAIRQGDASTVLRTLPEGIVHCCVTSPPYWGLREYGVDGQHGLEPTIDAYVAKQVEVFREVKRVLRQDGVCFVNLGDSYNSPGPSNHGKSKVVHRGTNADKWLQPSTRRVVGLKPKDLCMIPARVALALQADGWWLRSVIIWAKCNPMPESVTDRPTTAHEYIYLLTKSARYFYDAEAVREPLSSDPESWGRHSKKDPGMAAVNPRPMFGPDRGDRDGTEWGDGTGRNLRTVWTFPTQAFPEAHFATFPEELPRKCILAGTPTKTCGVCGEPWVRVVERLSTGKRYATGKSEAKNAAGLVTAFSGYDDGSPCPVFRTTGFRPTCAHNDDTGRALVLDPYMGSGTTAVVARELGRDYLGIELNPKYIAMAEARLRGEFESEAKAAAALEAGGQERLFQ